MFKYIMYMAVMAALLAVNATQSQELDPTRPLGAATMPVADGLKGEAEQGVVLNSILISSNRKIAIINGQAAHENQLLKNSGVKVIKIEADAVTLQQGDKVWRLPLNKIAVRK